MPKGIIDVFEPVKTEEQDRERLPSSLGILNLLIEPIFKECSIGQLREVVMHRQELKFLIRVGESRRQNKSNMETKSAMDKTPKAKTMISGAIHADDSPHPAIEETDPFGNCAAAVPV